MRLYYILKNLFSFSIFILIVNSISKIILTNSLQTKTKLKTFLEKINSENYLKIKKFKLEKKKSNLNKFSRYKYKSKILSHSYVDDWTNYQAFSNLLIFQCKYKNDFALTWDDGPHDNVTNSILDILKIKNVTSTFFFLAERLENETQAIAARRVYQEGHQIGSHSYNHPNLTITVSENKNCTELKHQIFDSDRIFRDKIGVSPKFFRPPFGDITQEIAITLKNWGYYIVLWNLDTKDWYWEGLEKLNIVKSYNDELKNPDPDYKMKDSYISLQHEHSMSIEGTIERYSYIIDLIREKGFNLVSMAECVGRPDDKYFEEIDYENKQFFFDD